MKIDYSNTLNFFKEKRRMCNSYSAEGCENCPLHIYINIMNIDADCKNFVCACPEKAIEIVQQWSDKHLQKTYKEDFFEKFPNAERVEKGYPIIAFPCRLYPQLKSTCNDSIYCSDCWDKVMEE